RAQPGDGSLPVHAAVAARGGGSGAGDGRVDVGRGGRARVDRAAVDARADRRPLARAAAGADAEVRLQLLERGGGDDPRQDRGSDQVAPAPRARVAPEAARTAREDADRRVAAYRARRMALEVGIVGLPGSGK